MDERIKNISSFIESKDIEQAERLFDEYFDRNKIGQVDYLEDVFSKCVHVMPAMRKLFSILKPSKTPPDIIDTTKHDGRMLFYIIYLMNRLGGARLIQKYLSKTILNTPQEMRFMGGIYFFNFDYENASHYYQQAIDTIGIDQLKEKHLFIAGNLSASFIYLNQYDKFEQFKNIIFERYDSNNAIVRSLYKYEFIKFIQNRDFMKANQSYKDCLQKGDIIRDENNQDYLFMTTLNYSISKDYNKFRMYLIKLCQQKKNEIIYNNIHPKFFFSLIFYIMDVTTFNKSDFKDIFDVEKITYPLEDLQVGNKILFESDFSEMGDSQTLNYINFSSGEYCINDKISIGLKAETRAIYYLIRSAEYGMTFEELASWIYSDDDYAGLFLIKKRVRQIISRIRDHFNLDIYVENYRIFLSTKVVAEFHLTNKRKLRISNKFSLDEFASFYKISISKAKINLHDLCIKGVLKKQLVGKKNIYSFLMT